MPLQRELKVKTLRLRQALTSKSQVFDSIKYSTLTNSLLHFDDELDDNEEEILMFTEALDIMEVEVPEDLREAANAIIFDKKIPISKNDTPNRKKNRFLSYTLNKKVIAICNLLTLKEICS